MLSSSDLNPKVTNKENIQPEAKSFFLAKMKTNGEEKLTPQSTAITLQQQPTAKLPLPQTNKSGTFDSEMKKLGLINDINKLDSFQ